MILSIDGANKHVAVVLNIYALYSILIKWKIPFINYGVPDLYFFYIIVLHFEKNYPNALCEYW